MVAEHYQVGDPVEVCIAGLSPMMVTEVLIDLEAEDAWYPALITAVLPDGRYALTVTPLVGSIEVPPVEANRLRRR